MVNEKQIYTLIPIDEFKALAGADDREDKLTRFSLVTSTLSIEQYCRRRFLNKRHFEVIEFYGDLILPLGEYPVSKMIAVFSMSSEQLAVGNGEILEPEFYSVIPDCGTDDDIPFSLSLSPAVARLGCKAVKAIYWAGYPAGKVPADLASACFELASWNMSRYKGRRVGMTGNIKGAGIQGEHFELAMPENVKSLLEPYRRKTI